MKKKLSMRDVAQQLNVSVTTVSLVLNGKTGKSGIRPELEQKILNHVREVGYLPNLTARSLRTGKSNVIAMLVEDISDPFFAEIARMLEQLVIQIGYTIFYASTENDTEKTKDLLRVFKERLVDAYIIAPPPGIEKDIRELMEDKYPVVMFDRYLPGLKTTNVLIDNFTGAYQAVQHLMENGYRDIALVTLDSEQPQMAERLNGYSKAVEERDGRLYVQKVSFGQEQDKMSVDIRCFLQKYPALDALLFSTNYLVASGFRAIEELNRDIPGDLAVISFDDNKYFHLLTPSVTAVEQPLWQMAEEVIQQLSLGLSGKEMKKENIIFPTKLIIRNSSLPAIKKFQT